MQLNGSKTRLRLAEERKFIPLCTQNSRKCLATIKRTSISKIENQESRLGNGDAER